MRNPGELSPANFFNGEPDNPGSSENAGFGITSGSGYGLKAIYTRWYLQNHLNLITDEEKAEFLSNKTIQAFLEANPPAPDDAEGDDDDEDRAPAPDSRTTFAHISEFKKKLADNPKIRNDYLSLCKSIKLGGDIPYNDDLIRAFSEFMGLHGLRATRHIGETSHRIDIGDDIVKELLDGNVQASLYLRRFLSIKLMQNFTFGAGEGTLKVYKNHYGHTIEIGAGDLPPLNPVADALWQARIDCNLRQQDAAQLAGVSHQHLSAYENGKRCYARAPFLHKLIGLYACEDLYGNVPFMRAATGVKAPNPLGYELTIARYRLGLSKRQFAQKIGVSDTYKYEMGIGLPTPETFRKICDALGTYHFLDNPTVMQQIIGIDKEKHPFAYQLRFSRFKKSVNMQVLAEAAGVSGTTISTYENSSSGIEPGHFKKIIEILGADDFLGNLAVMRQIVAIDPTKHPFAYQLKLNRYKKGLTAQELTDALGISASTVNHYEDGRTLPSPETFKKICDFFTQADFLENAAAMQQLIGFDQERQPFSYHLRFQLYKNGMNLQALADAIGKTISSTDNYQNGKRAPDAETLSKICGTLSWDIHEATAQLKAQQDKKQAGNHPAIGLLAAKGNSPSL